jgi:vacuolar-type H+-ATPase subunit I/STV1
MTSTGRIPWKALSEWNGQAFLAAAVLLAGVALYKGIGDFTSMTVPSAVDTGYGGLALLAPVVALLGLYPRIRESAPRLSGAAAVSSVLSAVAVFVIWAWFFGTTLQLGRFPMIPEEAPVWAAAALALNFLTLSVGFLLFGIASVRSSNVPKSVGLLLLIPGIMWIGLIVNIGVRAIPNMDFYVYIVNAVAVLAVGYLIWTGGQSTGRSDAVDDAIA